MPEMRFLISGKSARNALLCAGQKRRRPFPLFWPCLALQMDGRPPFPALALYLVSLSQAGPHASLYAISKPLNSTLSGRSLFKQVYHTFMAKYSVFCLPGHGLPHTALHFFLVWAKVRATTSSAPPWSRQAAHSSKVAPLVTTSSTSTMCFPATSASSRNW